MIRLAGGIPVLVHSRRSPLDESLALGDGSPGANDGTSSREKILWDLRVKVDLAGRTNHVSGVPGSSSGAEQGGAASAGERGMEEEGAPLSREG